jgi:hypothetical protein
VLVFVKAASIGDTSKSFRTRLLCPGARGTIRWLGTPDQLRDYLAYLRECYSGYSLLGVTIDHQKIVQLLFVMVGLFARGHIGFLPHLQARCSRRHLSPVCVCVCVQVPVITFLS